MNKTRRACPVYSCEQFLDELYCHKCDWNDTRCVFHADEVVWVKRKNHWGDSEYILSCPNCHGQVSHQGDDHLIWLIERPEFGEIIEKKEKKNTMAYLPAKHENEDFIRFLYTTKTGSEVAGAVRFVKALPNRSPSNGGLASMEWAVAMGETFDWHNAIRAFLRPGSRPRDFQDILKSTEKTINSDEFATTLYERWTNAYRRHKQMEEQEAKRKAEAEKEYNTKKYHPVQDFSNTGEKVLRRLACLEANEKYGENLIRLKDSAHAYMTVLKDEWRVEFIARNKKKEIVELYPSIPLDDGEVTRATKKANEAMHTLANQMINSQTAWNHKLYPPDSLLFCMVFEETIDAEKTNPLVKGLVTLLKEEYEERMKKHHYILSKEGVEGISFGSGWKRGW